MLLRQDTLPLEVLTAVSVQNIGATYKKVPIVLGVYPNTKKTATATVDFDSHIQYYHCECDG